MKINPVYILLVLVLLSYFNIFGNSFVWDDSKFIVDRPEIRSFNGAMGAFSEDVYGVYRPVRTVAFYAAYNVFGLNEFFFHLCSILRHAIVVLLIYLILKKLFNQKLAFLSSVLFAVAPIHIGRVTNITGSFDLIGIVFYLLSFYLYLIFREKKDTRVLLGSILVFLLGLFASEEVLTLPFLIVLYEMIFHNKKTRQFSNLFVFGTILGVFVFFRFVVLQIGARSSEYAGGGLVTLLTMPKVILEYIFLTLFPFQLSPFRDVGFVESLFSLWFIVPLLIILASVYFIFKFREKKEIVFFSGFFIITMLPFLNILPLQKLMAERYFYLASLSVFALLSILFVFLEKKYGKKVYLVFGIIVLFFVSMTLYQNTFWKDEFTLMSRGVELNPTDAKANNNLGIYYYNQGDIDKALYHYTVSLESDPEYSIAWRNLGVLYSKTGETEKAIVALKNAIANDNLNYKAYSMLGAIYYNNGDTEQGLEYIEAAIKINPDYAEPYFNLGLVYRAEGDDARAKNMFRKAYELEPDNELYRGMVS